MSEDRDHYEGVLLEEMNERLKGIQEGQESLAPIPAWLDDISKRLVEVASDVKIIKVAVKGHSDDIKELKQAVFS